MRNPSPPAPRSAGRKRGPTPCCSKVGLKRGPWTPEEDEILVTFVQREGEGRWRTLPKSAGLLRCGKSCRLRWMNYLRPSIKHGQISPDEEDLILRLHRLLGNRWSLIAGRIPGRTDNEIKNYWNTHLSKKLIGQGIDPRTHKPLNPEHKLKPPAHVTAPVPYPNPNVSCALEEIHGSRRGIMLDDHQSNYPGGFDVAHSVPWESSEAFAWMDLQRSHGGNGDEEDGGIDGCTDDVFTSFLDSLINEEMFLQPQQKQQKQDISNSGHNNDQNEAIDAAILPSTTGFSYGDLWQAGLPSPATLGEEVHDQFAGHTSKQF